MDIVCISSIDWDFIWQGHQQIMATFAEQGNRVLFIENTGVRRPTLRDLPRLAHRLRNWWKSTKGFREERPHLFVYSPVILPFPYARLARRLNRRLLTKAIQRWMQAIGVRRPIVWTFLPTPLARDLIQALDPEVTIYYCIDDLASSSPQARWIKDSETKLFQEADLVFVTSEKLRQRAAQFRRDVFLFPFGVDFERFERVRTSIDGVPEELQRLTRPIIGYIGGVHQWVDQEMVATLAKQLPSASVVLVGPLQTDVSAWAGYPNIHLVGPRSYADVPRYVKGFDVGVIPYRLSTYTAHVYPTKLNEYLAMGLPVVATDLPEIRRFNAEHGTVVAVARNPHEFISMVQEALTANSPTVRAQRFEVARQNSWRMRVEQMATLLEGRLETQRAKPARWDAALKRLYREARHRMVRMAVSALAIYLLVFHSPLLWIAAEPLRIAEPARGADAIVVFAGGVGESGRAGGGYQERVKQAVDLYREGKASHLIFSSGYAFVFQEANVMKELAVSLGIPASAILLEMKATNTHENVVLVADVVAQHGWRSVLFVSSPYHMRRALLTWRKVAPTVQVIPTPVPASAFYAHHYWGASLEQIHGILHEYLGLVYYWWKGWI